ncbi:MAG: hypothetical protein WD425_16350 [Nitrospirales bacterium]
MTTLRQFASLMTVVMLLPVLGCPESSRTDSEKTEQPGFTATVSGVVKGNLSGQGIVTYIAPQDKVSGKRPGYYLVSNIIHDVLVARDWVVTFRIPDGTHSGTYQLVSADPMNVGEEFEARLEGMVDTQPVSFRSNTEGSLTLDSFPSHAGQLSGSTIKGTFQFNAENSDGEVAEVNGAFHFPIKA